jgi:hypothetical protein
MELFIPSIAVLIFGALICVFILPRMSPYILAILCLVMFSLGVWQHYSMFPYEYRASMVTDMLNEYSGFIMLLGIIFLGIFTILLFRGSAGTNTPTSNSILPNVFSNSSKNSSNNIFNLGGNSSNNRSITESVGNAVENVVDNISKTVTNIIKPIMPTASNNLVSPSFKVS